MQNKQKFRIFYTQSKRVRGGNESLIDLLIVDVENKKLAVKINVSIDEKQDHVINGETISTSYTTAFGFDFMIKVLKKQGFIEVDNIL